MRSCRTQQFRASKTVVLVVVIRVYVSLENGLFRASPFAAPFPRLPFAMSDTLLILGASLAVRAKRRAEKKKYRRKIQFEASEDGEKRRGRTHWMAWLVFLCPFLSSLSPLPFLKFSYTTSIPPISARSIQESQMALFSNRLHARAEKKKIKKKRTSLCL